jgi:hypothetical protein
VRNAFVISWLDEADKVAHVEGIDAFLASI